MQCNVVCRYENLDMTMSNQNYMRCKCNAIDLACLIPIESNFVKIMNSISY